MKPTLSLSRVINASHSVYMLLLRTTTPGHSYKPAGLVLTSWQPGWIFQSGLGFLMVLAAHSPHYFNLKFWLFSYFGSQDTDPTIHNFSIQHRAHVYVHGSNPFKTKEGIYVKGSTFSSTLLYPLQQQQWFSCLIIAKASTFLLHWNPL